MANSLYTISYIQRRTSFPIETFMYSVSTDESKIVQSLSILANHILSTYCNDSPSFQRGNYRALLRRIEILDQLVDHVKKSGSIEMTHKAVTCLMEVYILLYKARDLLNYCLELSRLRLLLFNSMMSSYFHDLDQDLLCVMDVIPSKDMRLSEDLAEFYELLKKQLVKRRNYVDPLEESLKMRIFGFYTDIEEGKMPDDASLKKYFVKDLGIADVKTFRDEIESLEELISNHEAEVNVPPMVVKVFVALMRYSKLLIFGVEEDTAATDDRDIVRTNKASQGLKETFVTMPSDFFCPISHELMIDPVILVTGHTFDRDSIMKWFQKGNFICPMTRTKLSDCILVPNTAIKRLISMWCASHGTPHNQPPTAEVQKKRKRSDKADYSTRGILEVNKAKARLLLHVFSQGSESATRYAVIELRHLIESSKQICMDTMDGGGVPILVSLLKSENHAVQENAATSILHISLHDENKIPILGVQGFTESILGIVKSGLTDQAKRYAIATLLATLFTLSLVHENKKKLAKERDLLITLLTLLKQGGSRVGKLFSMHILAKLSTLEENQISLIEAGSVKPLVEALDVGALRKLAADALSGLVKKTLGAQEIRKEISAIPRLTHMLEGGSPSEKLAAVRALYTFYVFGGSIAMKKLLQDPETRSKIPSVLLSHVPESSAKVDIIIKMQEQLNRALLKMDW